MRWLFPIVLKLLLLAGAFLLAIGGSSAQAGNVAVLLSADVDAYRDAVRGFKETTTHQVVAEYDMGGDFTRGDQMLGEIRTRVKPDLILAVGIWALQVTNRQKLDIPVVFAMVLNPDSVIGTTANKITGASMNVPVGQQIQLLQQLDPRIRRIGVVFNPKETGYLVEIAKRDALEKGIQLVAREALSPKDAPQAINSLGDAIDAFWVLPDETMLDPKVLQYALLNLSRKKIPLVGLSERQAQMGALFSISYASGEDIGRQAGELANKILSGSRDLKIPYTAARNVKIVVNLIAAKKLGIDVPDSVLARADSIIR
jgi:putative ABC transport system substrate-binding protein